MAIYLKSYSLLLTLKSVSYGMRETMTYLRRVPGLKECWFQRAQVEVDDIFGEGGMLEGQCS
eukprot:7591401-Pyramimonas_sp.AAC.1